MTYDRTKFVEVDGYLIQLSMVAETLPNGVRLLDGRTFLRHAA